MKAGRIFEPNPQSVVFGGFLVESWESSDWVMYLKAMVGYKYHRKIRQDLT